MKRKSILFIFLFLVGLFSMNLHAETIALCINGVIVDTKGVPPVQQSGRVLVPVRAIFDEMGAMVDYKASEKKVYVDNGETLIVLELNSQEVWVNGEIITLDVPAQIIQEKTVIPLRFISETLGYQVQWLAAEHMVMIQAAPAKPDESQLPQTDLVIDDSQPAENIDVPVQDDTDVWDNDLEQPSISDAEREGKKVIMIDPGHGGSGSVGTTYGDIYEKDITLQMGNYLTQLLQSDPRFIVYETRNDDSFLDIHDRAALSNSIGPDLFISIHINSASYNTAASGTETYYYQFGDEAGKSFAEIVQQDLIQEFGTIDRGVKTNDYVVLKENHSPAVLIEIAFLSNEENRKMMLEPDFVQRYAETVYRSILTYYNLSY